MANRGNRQSVVISRPVPKSVIAAIRAEVMAEVQAAEERREAMRAEIKREEDKRAGRRNRNRVYLLVLTIINTFVAGYLLADVGLGWLVKAVPTTPVAMGFIFDLIFVLIAWKRKMLWRG